MIRSPFDCKKVNKDNNNNMNENNNKSNNNIQSQRRFYKSFIQTNEDYNYKKNWKKAVVPLCKLWT